MLTARVKHWTDELNRFTVDGTEWTPEAFAAEIAALPGGGAPAPEAVVDARVQKVILTAIKARLDAEPAWNQAFVATPDWKILHQLLTAARLRELTRVKIVKRGRTSGVGFGVGELARSFYGRQVLDALGFGKRRTMLYRDEFEKVRVEFAKIKLTLPEAVEPTTTERFFDTKEQEQDPRP